VYAVVGLVVVAGSLAPGLAARVEQSAFAVGALGAETGSELGGDAGSDIGADVGSEVGGDLGPDNGGGVAASSPGLPDTPVSTGTFTPTMPDEPVIPGDPTSPAGSTADAPVETPQPCSFTADTPVLLADGSTLAIGTISAGVAVTATDPGTGVTSTQTVTAVWPHQDQVWDLTLADGTLIHTTANHPWWDATTRTWTRTDHLVDGDQLATSTGGTVTIDNIQATDQTEATYNLTVTGPHTYYVGDDQVLVHNCDVDIENANFAQTTYSNSFSAGGRFPNETIDDVATALSTGTLSPGDVPIQVIVRDGQTLILNTRSAQALIRAGVPRSEWVIEDMTGDARAEGRLNTQLRNNGLTSAGTPIARATGR